MQEGADVDSLPSDEFLILCLDVLREEGDTNMSSSLCAGQKLSFQDFTSRVRDDSKQCFSFRRGDTALYYENGWSFGGKGWGLVRSNP